MASLATQGAELQKYLGKADAYAKGIVCGGLLFGRFIVPLFTGKATSPAYWNRLNQLGTARLGLLAALFAGDVMKAKELAKGNGSTADYAYAITDATTVALFLRATGIVHLSNEVANFVEKVCVTSWVIGASALLATSKDQGLKRNATRAGLMFAASHLIWTGKATPKYLAGVASSSLSIAVQWL